MSHTAIPNDELKVFKSLEDVKVIFDVGSRDDIDYLLIKPGVELHAFEPNPIFFNELVEHAKGYTNIYLNNFGLGNVEGWFDYKEGSQSIGDLATKGVYVRRGDVYAMENNITTIDFLKIDTEGYEYEVLDGLGTFIDKCRYIQYEKNKDEKKIALLLEQRGFSSHYIGGRNVLAVGKGEPVPWIPEKPQEGNLEEKASDRYTNWEHYYGKGSSKL